MSKVFLVRCPDYSRVDTKLTELLSMMGGIEQFVDPGQRIALKPNLLLAADRDKAVTTHPSVFAAAGRIVGKIAGSVVLVESPGSGYAYEKKVLEKTYQTCGMTEAAAASGVELNYDTSFEIISHPKGKLVKRFEVISPILRCDAYINLCKFKTHGLMIMTGGVKNIFGVIPGRSKPGYHSTMTTRELFAGMMLDLADAVPPKLTIMDAVVGMEGDGPFNGTPRHVGFLIASADPLAMDVVVSAMMGIPEDRNPLLVEARLRGMSPVSLADVEVVGISKDELLIPGYKLPASFEKKDTRILGGLMLPFVKNSFTVDPRIIKSACTACGACKKACPRDAITIDKVAYIHRDKCIRCYCCHEMCQYHAVELHKGLMYRMFN